MQILLFKHISVGYISLSLTCLIHNFSSNYNVDPKHPLALFLVPFRTRREWNVNGHEPEQTQGDTGGQGSLASCSPRDCKGLEMT